MTAYERRILPLPVEDLDGVFIKNIFKYRTIYKTVSTSHHILSTSKTPFKVQTCHLLKFEIPRSRQCIHYLQVTQGSTGKYNQDHGTYKYKGSLRALTNLG